jgi:CRISPR system Cascade subunit CasE
MFLSKLSPNFTSPEFITDIDNIDKLHRRIMLGFPDENIPTPRAESQVLFRVEEDRTILIQSKIEPNWSRLPDNYCIQAQTKLFTPKFQQNQELQFRLVGNPVRKHKKKVTKSLTETSEIIHWLESRSGDKGFKIQDVSIEINPTKRARRKDGRLLTIHSVVYQGALQVTDPELFTRAVEEGIGRARSYGCGLLSLSR